MSAAALLGIVVACLGVVFALAVWCICLMAGAARPLRRGSATPLDGSPSAGSAVLSWRPRPASGRPRTPRRTAGIARRSLHALWRD
ncbi:MAG TPA: hypothetical protein VGI81_16365 [Tepidisphaeraceae bacterium]|jgi:hypothetical protein